MSTTLHRHEVDQQRKEHLALWLWGRGGHFYEAEETFLPEHEEREDWLLRSLTDTDDLYRHYIPAYRNMVVNCELGELAEYGERVEGKIFDRRVPHHVIRFNGVITNCYEFQKWIEVPSRTNPKEKVRVLVRRFETRIRVLPSADSYYEYTTP